MALCAGQIAGIETGVHAVHTLFQKEDTEAVLLVDASNAFNALNRQTALHNIRRLCPALATPLINTYRAPSELYMDGDVLLTQEGTTQGDALALPMYALATIPLIRKLKDKVSEVNQVWYADDASGAGEINSLGLVGPCQHPRSNVWLLHQRRQNLAGYQEGLYHKAETVFEGTGVQITTEGRPYLGVRLGTEEYAQSFLSNKVKQWNEELNLLATIAHTQPHAPYAAFTHGMTSKWSYLSRSMMDASTCLHPIEHTIRTKLIPALTGRPPPNDIERDLLALPARLGGIALANPTQATATEFLTSNKIMEALQTAIVQQDFQYTS